MKYKIKLSEITKRYNEAEVILESSLDENRVKEEVLKGNYINNSDIKLIEYNEIWSEDTEENPMNVEIKEFVKLREERDKKENHENYTKVYIELLNCRDRFEEIGESEMVQEIEKVLKNIKCST